jgi:hypothetical protein
LIDDGGSFLIFCFNLLGKDILEEFFGLSLVEKRVDPHTTGKTC